MAGANIRTALFNAEIKFWESCGALSWDTRDFLEIFRVGPVFNSPAAMARISKLATKAPTT